MKKSLYIFAVILSLFQIKAQAQINIGGKPLSFSNKNISKDIPTILSEKQDNRELIKDAEANDTKDRPWQFGKNIDVNIDVKKQAVIDMFPKGILYRLAIKSEDATTLNLRFSNYMLPEDANLYIYSLDKSNIIGGFTNANNQANEIFATGLLKGDYIILEYYEPSDAEFPGKLIIDRITHGFRTVNDYGKSFGSSGDCNMNVACTDADNWQNEVSSVCMLVTGGSGFCSATLVNNTTEDGTPYILTADHCYSDPADLVFMFNWESEICDNPTLSPSHNDLSGAVLIARNTTSDFCLFEMNDVPPYYYDVYYAGWETNDVPSTSSVCIHHPKADIKKVSFDDEPSFSDYYLANQGVQDSHWKVIWDRATTTEPGSSGSPLFNENHRIIGQLHGGYASCYYLDEPDWYGKFSYSWDYGNSPDKRLKDWLDPINAGVTGFDGYDPNLPVADNDVQILGIISPESYYFGVTGIIPTFKIRNRGNLPLTSFEITYILDNESPVSKQWNGNLNSGEIIDVIFDEINLVSGKYNLQVYTENPNGTNDEYKQNDTAEINFFIYETIFKDDFENDNSWYLTGEFEINKPKGIGGGVGFPDPEYAISGEYVLGTDLTGKGQHEGDYENNIFEAEFAVSPVIDCRYFKNTLLSFERWLGTDKGSLDYASVNIFADSVWTTVWDNSNTRIIDSEWKSQTFDISEIADGKKIIIKFVTGPTNHAEQYCGWNIDDFMVAGIRSSEPVKKEEHIKIFPNPASNYFYIEVNDEIIENATVIISDLSGKVIFNKEFKPGEIKSIETTAFKKSIIKIELAGKIAEMLIINVKTKTKKFSNKVVVLQKGK
ncbi:MAG: T9SS type A sorting domain-containing protein [Bacteroidales bacterium]|nr:T9SS type A sorting domain-containing protein [Bacteroidales bacterium]